MRWLILIYHLPREPSRYRVAVWRKLKTLGALYLQDGAAGPAEEGVHRGQVELAPLRIREVGGEATLWEARPNTLAEGRALVEEFRASREAAYRDLIEAATKLRRKAAFGADGAALLEELAGLERDFRAERRRDYFRSPLRKAAGAAIREARLALKEGRPAREGAG